MTIGSNSNGCTSVEKKKSCALTLLFNVAQKTVRAQLRLTNWLTGFCVATGLAIVVWQGNLETSENNMLGWFIDSRSGIEWTMWDSWHLKRTVLIFYPGETQDYEDLLLNPYRRKNPSRMNISNRQIPKWCWIARRPQEFLGSDNMLVLKEIGVGWPSPFAIRAYTDTDATRVSKWLISIDRWPHVLNVNYGLWKIRVVNLVISSAFFAFCIGLIRSTLAAIRNWRRKSKGCCGNCGYSLEGLKGSRCPECGTTSNI